MSASTAPDPPARAGGGSPPWWTHRFLSGLTGSPLLNWRVVVLDPSKEHLREDRVPVSMLVPAEGDPSPRQFWVRGPCARDIFTGPTETSFEFKKAYMRLNAADKAEIYRRFPDMELTSARPNLGSNLF